VTPEAREALDKQIRDYYDGRDLPEEEWESNGGPGRPTGGSLHIVLDDGNVDDRSVWFCYGYAAALNDEPGVAIARALIPLTEDERREVAGW
jgi:hypothetical protein